MFVDFNLYTDNEFSERIYPESKIAAAIVWCMDKLPENIRGEILKSYWSPADIAAVEKRADDLWDFFESEEEIKE